jgi:hypothetical protein
MQGRHYPPCCRTIYLKDGMNQHALSLYQTHQGSVGELSSLGPCSSNWDMHVREEDKGSSLEPPPPLIPVPASSVGIQRAWRQPREGWPLHIWDELLQGLTVNRGSMLYFKTIVLTIPPILCFSCTYLYIVYTVFLNRCGVQLRALVICH